MSEQTQRNVTMASAGAAFVWMLLPWWPERDPWHYVGAFALALPGIIIVLKYSHRWHR